MRDPNDNVRVIISPTLLRRVGLRAVELIKTNTLAGTDAEGIAFVGYSTNGFSRPAGSVPKVTLQRLEAEGSVSYFRSRRTGSLWIHVEDGYLEFKRARNPSWRGTVDLSDTGEMLRALEVQKIEERSVTIGFKTAEAAKKAYFHNIAGAGRRHAIRKFLGLPARDMDEIKRMVLEGITVKF